MTVRVSERGNGDRAAGRRGRRFVDDVALPVRQDGGPCWPTRIDPRHTPTHSRTVALANCKRCLGLHRQISAMRTLKGMRHMMKGSRLAMKRSPYTMKRLRLTMKRSSLTMKRPPLTMKRLRLTMKRLRLTMKRSRFTMRASPFTMTHHAFTLIQRPLHAQCHLVCAPWCIAHPRCPVLEPHRGASRAHPRVRWPHTPADGDEESLNAFERLPLLRK